MTRYSLLACAGALMASLAFTGPAFAAGSDSGDSGYESDTDSEAFQSGMEAADAGNWDLAITKFTVATTEDPSSADSFNMLAYSYRNKGDYDQAFRYYEKALTLDPEHANAHEYVGEAYLAVGDLAKAEEHLAALDDICWLGCEQYDELEEAIEAYKSNN